MLRHTGTTSSRDPRDLLPLTPAMFHVLIALADQERHGYAIIKDVAHRTAGRVTLGTGTLYGIVKRLLAEGLIVESKRRPAAADDDERPWSLRIVRALLRLLPGEFRGDFADQMAADLDASAPKDAASWRREVRSLARAVVREHLDALRQDVTYALRTMRRTPGA